jgi:hypothetical protein
MYTHQERDIQDKYVKLQDLAIRNVLRVGKKLGYPSERSVVSGAEIFRQVAWETPRIRGSDGHYNRLVLTKNASS